MCNNTYTIFHITTAGMTAEEVISIRVNKKALLQVLAILADLATIAGFIFLLIDRLG
jgi:hypothetical protein